jgi:hypothetical protein
MRMRQRVASATTGRGRRFALVAALAAIGAAVPVSPASADFGIVPGSFTTSVVDQNGVDYTQAGGHPYAASTSFMLNSVQDPEVGITPEDGGVHDVQVDLPPGFVGDPQATDKCPIGQLAGAFPTCPVTSQVGTVDLTLRFFGTDPSTFTIPVYNIKPQVGSAGVFGFDFLGQEIVLYASVRSDGDYGLRVVSPGVNQSINFLGAKLTFYGDPATVLNTGAPSKPFLTNPTECSDTAPVTTLKIDSWNHPGDYKNYTATSPKVTGCDQLHFDPTITVTPDSTEADNPSGYTVDIGVPQTDDMNTLATATLKNATVTLPPGVILNAGTADGLQGCTDAQFGEHDGLAANCPLASKIGTAEITTPLLDHKLPGSVFLRTPDAGAHRTTGLYAIFLDIEDPISGVIVKLRGNVVPDAATGQLTATFTDNPPLPFSDFKLMFKGGGRAALANPQTCGPNTTATSFSSWGGPTATPGSAFTTSWDGQGGACPGSLPFDPVMSAGTLNPSAGASSPFTFSIGRGDRQDIIDGLTATLPTGLLASIKDVPLCSDADANAGTCPAATRVGSATVGAGAGPNPFHITGTVSLTGAYKGGPYGLAIAVHAVAGPLDLGWVVVRQSIQVDPNDAHLVVTSDPIPTIQEGAPFRLRTINVLIDRASFMRSPTNCDAKQIDATVHSVGGVNRALTQSFGVQGCSDLPFDPKLALKLNGVNETKVGGHPGIEANVTQQPGEAALKSATVTLPLSLALDPDNAVSDDLCSFGDGLQDKCPEGSVIGTATAVSPLLNQPLTGKVFFVKGLKAAPDGHLRATLPTLLVELRGEINVNLRANTSVPDNKHLVTTFPLVPDAAISSFKLSLNGGPKGILEVTDGHDVCVGPQEPFFTGIGQNGKRIDTSLSLTADCKVAVSRTFTSTSVSALVSGVGPGTVTVSGTGIKTTKKTLKSGTNVTVVAKLTAQGKKLRKAKKDVRVKVSFVPKGSTKATVAYSAKPKAPAKKPKAKAKAKK